MPAAGGYPLAQPYAGHTTYAGFWIRLVARLLDGLIIGIPFSILFGLFGAFGALFANSSSSSNQNAQQAAVAVFGGAFLILWLCAIVVSFGYWIYFWGSTGQTLGMRLLRLRIVGASTGGSIGYGRAVIRLLMTFVNTWACYIGWIWVAFDPRKQGWHDKVANSVVIQY